MQDAVTILAHVHLPLRTAVDAALNSAQSFYIRNFVWMILIMPTMYLQIAQNHKL